MQTSAVASLSRRSFLVASGGAAVGAVFPILAGSPAPMLPTTISLPVPGARTSSARRIPRPRSGPTTARSRARRSGCARASTSSITVENRLAEETTVHWHGLRVPNAMDGVPHLTQRPIAPGETFVYEFDVPDAGTYWYHPHQRSFEQVGRGLYGPLIVEEREPIQVDRDVTWVLDDWRLLPDAQISDDFGNFMDASHNGRVGNTVTVNGRIPETFAVRAGERAAPAADQRRQRAHLRARVPGPSADGDRARRPAGRAARAGRRSRRPRPRHARRSRPRHDAASRASASRSPTRSIAASNTACSTSSTRTRRRCASIRSMRRCALPPTPCPSPTWRRPSATRSRSAAA